MEVQGGDETDDRLRYPHGDPHQVGIAERSSLSQVVNAPAQLLQKAAIAKAIERTGMNATLQHLRGPENSASVTTLFSLL